MTSDPAAFKNAELQAIHGTQPSCFLTRGRKQLDKHHIFSRGELFGIKPSDPERYLFSSPYNCGIIENAFHVGGYRDHHYMRALLLEITKKKVQEAIIKKQYVATMRDRDFLALAEQWLAQHNL